MLIVGAVMLAALMQTLDQTITNVALPTIQGNLGASQDEGTWVITSYVIASIVVIPLTPWLQNRFGRRNYLVASVIGFTLASVACGAADSLTMLVIGRAVQGAFGGGLLVTGQSILRDTFPPEQLGTSQGIFAIGAIMGPACGPPLGGILVDNWSWNWCFDINILPGIVSAVILHAVALRDPEKSKATPVDFGGLALLAVTSWHAGAHPDRRRARTIGSDDRAIATLAVVCLVSAVGFVFCELPSDQISGRRPAHLQEPQCVGRLDTASRAWRVAAIGSIYILPQFTQGALSFTSTLSGLMFMLRVGPDSAFMTPIIVRLVRKVDPGIFACASAFSWWPPRTRCSRP